MIYTVFLAAVLGASGAITASEDRPAVFSGLEVRNGSVGWNGLFLGMGLAEIEKVLGYPVQPTSILPPSLPSVEVVVKGRIGRLSFLYRDGELVLGRFVLTRMAFDDPKAWTGEALLRALRAWNSSVQVIPSEQHAARMQDSQRPVLCSIPGVEGVWLLLKPEEEVIYLGLEDSWVD